MWSELWYIFKVFTKCIWKSVLCFCRFTFRKFRRSKRWKKRLAYDTSCRKMITESWKSLSTKRLIRRRTFCRCRSFYNRRQRRRNSFRKSRQNQPIRFSMNLTFTMKNLYHWSISPTFYEQLLRQFPFDNKIQHKPKPYRKDAGKTFVRKSFS